MKSKNLKKKKSDALKIKDCNRVIVPVDGSDGSKKAAQQALRLAKKTGKDVTAMYVVDTPRLTQTIPDNISIAWETILEKQGHELLNEIEKIGKKMGVRVIKKLVEGIPDDEIVKEAKKNDIIAMGCKKKSTLDKLLTGSVCEKVIHHSSSPLMIYQIKNEKSD